MLTRYRTHPSRPAHRAAFRLGAFALVAIFLFLAATIRPALAAEEGRANGVEAPLADHVPSHAILYLGWRGAKNLSHAYEGSRLRAVVDATDFKQLGKPFLPALIDRIDKENKDAGDAVRTALDVAKPMWEHPSAFVFAGLELAGDKPPTPHLALICQAGKEAESLEKTLRPALDEAKKATEGQIPGGLELVRHGGLVAIVVGGEKAIFPDGGAGEKAAASLAGDEGFQSSLKHLVKEPAFVGYVDLDRVRELLNTAVDGQGDDDAKRIWPKVREATGLDGLHNAVWSSGFDGKDWEDQAFVSAPEPRRGLVSLIDQEAVSDDGLKSIPQGAMIAGVGRIDAAKAVEAIRKIATDVDPQAGTIFDAALKQASDSVGVDLEADLLKSLGDEWVYYADPRTGGRGVLGSVVINHLKDAEKAEKALEKLEKLANEQLESQLKNEDVKVSFQTTESDGIKIHYLATPVLTPSWAVHGGNLYVALFPQVVVSAADARGRGKATSILDNKRFTALRERLGVDKATGLQFLDLPQTAPDSYAQWLMISRLSGFADLFGIKSPAMLAPPLSKLLPQLTAAGSATWADKDGWHAKAVSPFPGSTALGSDPFSSGIGAESVMVSTLLPALNKARGQANRVKSASNLKQIGLAAMLYANDKQGNFPKDLAEIYKTQELSLDVFINPSTQNAKPAGLTDKHKQAEWVEQNSDYVWVGAGLKSDAGSEVLLAYEKPETATEGVNLLFADGHVEFLPLEEAQKKIEAAKPTKAGEKQ